MGEKFFRPGGTGFKAPKLKFRLQKAKGAPNFGLKPQLTVSPAL